MSHAPSHPAPSPEAPDTVRRATRARVRWLAVPVAALVGLVGLVGLNVAPSNTAVASAPLRQHADAQGVLIGAAVATGPLGSESQYDTTLAREFNAVTAENAMKWDATEPSQGQFNWSGADEVMNFAESNSQTVHGHTLVWHNQTPSWVQNLSESEMRTAMQEHIAAVVGRYQGRIASWDVVNEAFNDDGSLRNSFWLQTLGESYIADAFQAARQADPNARLCINDYNVEGINAKSTAMYNLVSDLRSQGVPVDCVGLQGHLAVQFGFPNDIQQNLQRFADLGVQVRITELDVRMELPADASKLATQADYYGRVVDACLAVSACAGVTTWGFTDRYSWVPDTFPGQGAALPYDENYNSKPAYDAIHEALGGGTPDPDPDPDPAGDCQVDYVVQNDWGTGFTGQITITNTGSTLNGWALDYTFPGNQDITNGWNATWTQDGPDVAATNATWNTTMATNTSTTIGFNAAYIGTNNPPTAFTLNGVDCGIDL